MMAITDRARQQFLQHQVEAPDEVARIVFTPACGGAGLSIEWTTLRFRSDVQVEVHGVSLVYAKQIAHLLEDITIEWLDAEDEAGFLILNGPPTC
ncbi:hypothetical protein [Alicyclobacillus contaminans]|uniref:hypothetical protein n=1 Tax=Alicyclobacillus contaminans TaxID=392016 RepID=UPI000416B737|nr:hypothetical protein [Alicyclobacillus contaminans]